MALKGRQRLLLKGIDMSHLPRVRRLQSVRDRALPWSADTGRALEQRGITLDAKFATILKMSTTVTASPLMPWHRAQPGAILATPPKTGGRGLEIPGSTLK